MSLKLSAKQILRHSGGEVLLELSEMRDLVYTEAGNGLPHEMLLDHSLFVSHLFNYLTYTNWQ
jgi:hypothetical protein